MAKWVSDHVLDGALGVVSSARRMVALDEQPADYPAAMAARLAEVALAAEDFTLLDGAQSGRMIAITEKPAVPVATAGEARHVALLDPVLQRLLYVTTCPVQTLEAGGQVNFGAWTIEIGDPA